MCKVRVRIGGSAQKEFKLPRSGFKAVMINRHGNLCVVPRILINKETATVGITTRRGKITAVRIPEELFSEKVEVVEID